MKINAETARGYHCPRWGELPNIPLYMDQVIFVLEEALGLFSGDEKSVTPTMVNNYVKQGVIRPPEKKKYGRAHVAELIVVSIMKRVLSMNELIVLKRALIDAIGIEDAYELYCSKLEQALCATFTTEGETPVFQSALQPGPLATLDAAMAALMGKLYVQNFVREQGAPPKKNDGKAPPKKDKTNKTKD